MGSLCLGGPNKNGVKYPVMQGLFEHHAPKRLTPTLDWRATCFYACPSRLHGRVVHLMRPLITDWPLTTGAEARPMAPFPRVRARRNNISFSFAKWNSLQRKPFKLLGQGPWQPILV